MAQSGRLWDIGSNLGYNNSTTLSEDVQKEETVKDYTHWESPNKAKKRLGKGRIREIQFSPNGKQLAVGTEIGLWMYDVETGQEISLWDTGPLECVNRLLSHQDE